MSSLKEKMRGTTDFLFGVELVSNRGIITEKKAIKAQAFAENLTHCNDLDWVSITDNAGGNPMLRPIALGRPILDGGKEVVIHLSCKDFNRNALESEAWLLSSEGFHNILTLTGDYPVPVEGGMGKPVFDIDSIGLLKMLSDMNEGLPVSGPGGRKQKLEKTQFLNGAVVSNFKLHENEVMPQLFKLEKKIEMGADFIVNQIGYDSRKIHELLIYMKDRKIDNVPLIGNVYLLTSFVAKLFNSQKIPGVIVSDELRDKCVEAGKSDDKGKTFFLELAAKQIAIYKGLGYRGAYLGGAHNFKDVERIIDIEKGFSNDDWKIFAKEIRFGQPGEFYLYEEDKTTCLANPSNINPEYLKSLDERVATENVTCNYRLSKIGHKVLFEHGKGLAPLAEKIVKGSKDQTQGPWAMRMVEHIGKTVMFDCKDCGDCSLPEIAFLCPESQCAKNQRNGPCGGTRNGKCESREKNCIWARAYDRLKSEGKTKELLDHVPAIQDQEFRGTSGWANNWLGKDHIGKRNKKPDNE